MKNKETLVAFIAGAAAGAVAGILLAPDSGRNNFSKLRQSATDLLHDLEALSQDTLQNYSFGTDLAEDIEVAGATSGNTMDEDPEDAIH